MLRRFIPSHEALKKSQLLRWLGPRVHDPSLWHFSRRAVARGAAIGAFFGLLTPIAQIPAAALVALLVRANIWVATACTFVTNPFTYGPLYYFAYRLGSRFVESPDSSDTGTGDGAGVSLELLLSLWTWVIEIGRPLALGLLLMAIVGAVLGYIAAQLFWRTKVLAKRRRLRHARSLRTVN